MTASSSGAPGPLELSIVNAVSRSGLAALEAGDLPPSTRPPGAFALEPASSDLLARVGLFALRDALERGDDRAAAFDLLTADALITMACDAAATGELPESLSADHFATLLEETQ